MEKIELKDLIKEINSQNSKKYIINFEGMITAQTQFEKLELREDKDKIKIMNLSNKEKEIELSKHQIMKIEKNQNTYIISFDAPQKVKLKQII